TGNRFWFLREPSTGQTAWLKSLKRRKSLPQQFTEIKVRVLAPRPFPVLKLEKCAFWWQPILPPADLIFLCCRTLSILNCRIFQKITCTELAAPEGRELVERPFLW